jgi:hypothetical protein
MQICPGDLLVYSRVLTHKASTYEIDGSTQSLLGVNSESGKKGKAWTLLKLFDREKKLKDEGVGGLQGVLGQIKPSEFQDTQLAQLAPFSWGDFVDFMKAERAGRRKSSRRPSMNVSRLPGYSRLEEELEADDLLRAAAVEGQRPIQDLLDSLSAEELDSCGQGPLGTNCGPLGSNVEELGGQYTSHQGTSAYPEGSPYDRCKGNSTASSSSGRDLITKLTCS